MKLIFWSLAVALALTSLTGCAKARPSCTDYQSNDTHVSSTSTLEIFIDLPSNSPAAAEAITGQLRPYLEEAVNKGSYIRVQLDGGDGLALVTPPCFDGQTPFIVERNNERREASDRVDATNALSESLKAAILGTDVSRTGTAARLLTNVASANDASDTKAGRSILWSSLLGVSEGDSNCLSLSGLAADPSTASAVIRRCLDAGQLNTVPRGSLTLLGFGYGAVDAPQTRMASLVAAEICRQLSQGCQEVKNG